MNGGVGGSSPCPSPHYNRRVVIVHVTVPLSAEISLKNKTKQQQQKTQKAHQQTKTKQTTTTTTTTKNNNKKRSVVERLLWEHFADEWLIISTVGAMSRAQKENDFMCNLLQREVSCCSAAKHACPSDRTVCVQSHATLTFRLRCRSHAPLFVYNSVHSVFWCNFVCQDLNARACKL